jgi:HEAT repeat protein
VARIAALDECSVIVGFTRMQATRLRWIYDSDTLLPARAEAGDLDAARLEYTFALLAALGHTEAAPTMAALYEHPDHFVRWSAIRRVIELDPAIGEALVHRALNDVHPHVRRAAQRTLERYQASRSTEVTQERNSHGAHA